jgi:TatD DNase family protein
MMMELVEKHPEYCIPMMGLHPCYVDGRYEAELNIVSDWLERRPFAAIGEIGLDFYHSVEFKTQQEIAFQIQIELAIAKDLPIVIHSRSSMDECIKMIAQHGRGKARGIFHCFGGDERQAKNVIELGFYLGIGGVVTYKNAGLAKIVEETPLEYLVLETDAPYLSPVPYRGKRNESSYIVHVAQKIAELKGISIEEVNEMTTDNAKKIFAF